MRRNCSPPPPPSFPARDASVESNFPDTCMEMSRLVSCCRHNRRLEQGTHPQSLPEAMVATPESMHPCSQSILIPSHSTYHWPATSTKTGTSSTDMVPPWCLGSGGCLGAISARHSKVTVEWMNERPADQVSSSPCTPHSTQTASLPRTAGRVSVSYIIKQATDWQLSAEHGRRPPAHLRIKTPKCCPHPNLRQLQSPATSPFLSHSLTWSYRLYY